MSEKKVQTKNADGEVLIGVESLPDQHGNSYPTVILVHGFAYYKEEDGIFVALAKRLASEGVSSYRFDFSGCGESEGNYINTTLSKLRDDLASILEFVKSKPTVDTKRLGIVAQSFGTTVTIALEPEIKSLVMMGSILNGKEIIKDLFGEGYRPDGISVREESDKTTEIKPDFWKDFENHNLKNSVKQLNYPLLLIHGSKDDHVPISEMEAIFNLKSEPRKKVILEGTGHDLKPKRTEVYDLIVDWFKETL